MNKPFKYALVGLAGTAVQYVILISLVEGLTSSALLATCIGFVAGAIVNYILNYRVTFNSHAPHQLTMPKFMAVAGICFFVNGGVMLWSTQLPYLLCQVIASAAVLVTGYLLNALWTFRYN